MLRTACERSDMRAGMLRMAGKWLFHGEAIPVPLQDTELSRLSGWLSSENSK